MSALNSVTPIPDQPWSEEVKQPLLAGQLTGVVDLESDLKVDEEVKPSDLETKVEEDVTPEIKTELQQVSLLEELTSVDRVFVTRKLRIKSVIFLRGKKNKFIITTSEPKVLYTVEELNRWWVGYLFYHLRPLQLKVTNSSGAEVMRIIRPYACTSRILPCQLQRLLIKLPNGEKLGSIEQLWTPVRPNFIVKDSDGEFIFSIRGPLSTISCFNEVQFYISRMDGQCIGAACKKWQGVIHSLFMSPITDQYGLAFEKNLEVNEKALLLAASILIDYMYFS